MTHVRGKLLYMAAGHRVEILNTTTTFFSLLLFQTKEKFESYIIVLSRSCWLGKLSRRSTPFSRLRPLTAVRQFSVNRGIALRLKVDSGSSPWEWEERRIHFISASAVVCIRIDHLSKYLYVTANRVTICVYFLESSNPHMYDNMDWSTKGQRARHARIKVRNEAGDFNDERLRSDNKRSSGAMTMTMTTEKKERLTPLFPGHGRTIEGTQELVLFYHFYWAVTARFYIIGVQLRSRRNQSTK